MNENEIVVQKEEFRRIIKVFADHGAMKTILQNYSERIEVLGRIISDRDSVITHLNENVDILKEEKELIKPAWWDNFWLGFATGGLAVFLLTLLLK